ncbi:hypothetical protein GQ43DRAFT_437303 [Delitschia confertaspora ATCC 74209]|uniref:Uncharacterized protein n=1 Tax=Delitschia confertaspora ATCC 74209 TaxID=1513339 RepID=A0A9P4JZ44_9PLEO|nr:hypothetical protein GQ43DRAFT_437303 [Delitschia confertaspora ATCC 74209]
MHGSLRPCAHDQVRRTNNWASYNKLHLTAWNAPFGLGAQTIFWRIAALALVSSGPLMTACVFLERTNKA